MGRARVGAIKSTWGYKREILEGGRRPWTAIHLRHKRRRLEAMLLPTVDRKQSRVGTWRNTHKQVITVTAFTI